MNDHDTTTRHSAAADTDHTDWREQVTQAVESEYHNTPPLAIADVVASTIAAIEESSVGPLAPVEQTRRATVTEVVGWLRAQFWFPATPGGVASAIEREFHSRVTHLENGERAAIAEQTRDLIVERVEAVRDEWRTTFLARREVDPTSDASHYAAAAYSTLAKLTEKLASLPPEELTR